MDMRLRVNSMKLSEVMERFFPDQSFMEMMEYCVSNDVKTIVFENTTRFSRDLICTEIGFVYLKGLGFTLMREKNR